MEFSKKEIIEIATKVKDFVDKNKVLPLYVDKGSRITKSQYLYLFSKLISIINTKGVNKQAYTEQVITKNDKINVKLSKEEYLDVSKRVVKFMETNKKNPAYVNVKGKKISTDLVNYCFAKILVWYGKHNNTLPLTCLFNSDDLVKKNIINSSTSTNKNKTIYKGSKYLTSSSNGLGQDTSYYCGDNAMQQAIYHLTGKIVSESKLAGIAGTTTAGTSHQGLETIATKYGLKINWFYFSDIGWHKLGSYLESKNHAVFWHELYRNKYGHYSLCNEINITNNTLKILNSLGTKKDSKKYTGYIETRSFNEQKSYWNGISQKSIAIVSKK